MKSDLKNLQSQQEIYYSSTEGAYNYTDDQGALEFTASQGVTVDITEAANTGWAATAVHAALDATTQTCGVYVGEADPANAGPATAPGVVTCEGE
jgi:hypothetical protein